MVCIEVDEKIKKNIEFRVLAIDEFLASKRSF